MGRDHHWGRGEGDGGGGESETGERIFVKINSILFGDYERLM